MKQTKVVAENIDIHDFVIAPFRMSHKQILKDEDLITIANTWQILQGEQIGRGVLTYLVSTSILNFYLGSDWTKRNIFLRGGNTAKIPELLRPNSEDIGFLSNENSTPQEPDAPTNKTIKAIEITMGLANTLYNLQGVRGFRRKIQEYKNENVEAFFTELQSAQILCHVGAYLEFPEPVGKKALDYDIIAKLPDEVVIACDAKCKVESATYSPAAIKNVIRKARSQLPKHLPTVVFIKVPESWAEAGELYTTFGNVITDALRGTTRVSAVIVFKAQFYERGADYKYDMSLKQFQNAQATLPIINLETIFPEMSDRPPKLWRSLFDIVR